MVRVLHPFLHFDQKAFLFLLLLFCVSCNKGYHYKYWIFPYYEDKKIDTSSRENFEILTTDFARDKNQVYYNEHILTGVDTSSLEILNSEIFKDRFSVYNITTNTEIKTNSPKAWIIIIPLDLKVWTESKIILVKLANAIPEKFRLLKHEGIITNYGYDGEHLFYKSNHLEDLKEKEIQFIKSPYFKILLADRTLYFEGNRIEGADFKSFVVFDQYAKDKESCFYLETGGEIRKFICNAKNLIPLQFPNPLNSNVMMDSSYAIDNKNAYWEGKVISQADIKTFQLTSMDEGCLAEGYCAKDKNRQYDSGSVKEN